jgi:hypothetical protein
VLVISRRSSCSLGCQLHAFEVGGEEHAFEVGGEERERKQAIALNTLGTIHARAETAQQRVCCGDGAPAAGVLGCTSGSN